MAGGSGVFYSDSMMVDKDPVIDANNVYDVSRMFADNNS
jgi:hypothetical protein